MALPNESSLRQQAADLAARGRWEEAQTLFLDLAQHHPEDASVWRGLANVTPDPKLRIEHLEKALELHSEDSATRADLHKNLVRRGVTEAQTERFDSARRCFKRAAQVMPGDDLALLWLVEVSEDAEERTEALENLFELRPQDPSIRGALSRNLAEVGHKASEAGEKGLALNHFRRAHKLHPENVDVLYFLAREDAGRELSERLGMLETVLEQRADDQEARDLWNRLAQLAVTQSSTVPVNGCPLCRAPKEPGSMSCETCGAKLSLFDLDKLLNNSAVDRVRVAHEAARLEKLAAASKDWKLRHHLLLARLNLGEKEQAAREVELLLEQIPLNEPERLEVEQVRLFLARGRQHQAAPETVEIVTAQSLTPHVLVVDDSATVRALVGATLQSYDYELSYAGTGMEALAALRKTVPDLVLLDIGLPNMDGYQLCQLIRQNPATAEVPVVMLSARDGFFDQVRGRMVGCQDYITKPFDADDLVERVGKLVGT